MDISEIYQKAQDFSKYLQEIKSSEGETTQWYPYPILENFNHLSVILSGRYRQLLDFSCGKPIMDVGAADGDLAFFLESLGYEVHIMDYASTNHNRLSGVRKLREILKSNVTIFDIDLDSQFQMPNNYYGLLFFLGTLYHLQNPFYILRSLSTAADYCVLSTRIAQTTVDRQTRLSDVPVAYLVSPYETNNDPTNYWIFSDVGLRRLLDRTGWDICSYGTVGQKVDSDPSSNDRDERAFCLIHSRCRERY
jgi:tRNA (mo5U34)-methyltransferase